MNKEEVLFGNVMVGVNCPIGIGLERSFEDRLKDTKSAMDAFKSANYEYFIFGVMKMLTLMVP